METVVSSLRPVILEILQRQESPSKRSVRSELSTLRPEIDMERNKLQVNALIVDCFDAVPSCPTTEPIVVESKKSKKSKTSTLFEPVTEDEKPVVQPEASSAELKTSKSKKRPKSSALISDDEVESGSEPSSSASPLKRMYTEAEFQARLKEAVAKEMAKLAKKSSTSFGKSKKSGEQEGEKVVSTTGFNKPHRLSKALAAVCGEEILSRPQVTKQLWVYIKENNLQDPDRKIDILPDALLRRVFDMDRLTSFQMAKYLSPHLSSV